MQPTDCKLCVLCRLNKHDQALICPAKGTTDKSVYDYIANNLLEFDQIGRVPMNISLRRLNDVRGIVETLKSNQAAYYKC